jgi:hypothetical protein
MSLRDVARITDAVSQRSSSWDRTGGNIDCVTDLAPGKSAVLLETDGPGRVTHIWLTYMEYPGHATALRDLVLRMTWEGADVPAVEVPLGDFFGLGHALPPVLYWKRHYTLKAEPITVGLNERSCNCYWPLPFRRHARIEVFNNGERSLRQLYFHVDYELGPQPEDVGLFHAVFRQEKDLGSQSWMNPSGKDNYTILETEGRGHYAGCILYVDQRRDGWFGEGDDMIFVDRAPMPTINGTGTEDYFNNAWCYHEPFSYPYYGCPLMEKRKDGTFYTMYRFHVPDPVRFKKHIRVSIEHVWGEATEKLGGGEGRNGYASVAYWYQDQPLRARATLPSGEANLPVLYPELITEHASVDPLNVPAMEVSLRRRGLGVSTIFVIGQEWLRSGGAIRIATKGVPVELPLPVARAGTYRVEVQPVNAWLDVSTAAGVKGGEQVALRKEDLRRESDAAFRDLGTVKSAGGTISLVLSGREVVGFQGVRLTKLD